MGRVSDAKERLMRAVLELIRTGSYGSTTVDLICEKAGVQKGSFYYFFDGKADLAAAALEAEWEARRPQFDAMFSPTVPPLERLRKLAEFTYQRQAQLKKTCGCVLGCTFFTLGAEICLCEHKVRRQIQEILGHYRRYFENAIREAQAEGLVEASDVAAKARMVFAYYEGLLTQARILNNAELLREMPRGIFALLGIKDEAAAA